jgi:hypothetical protein
MKNRRCVGFLVAFLLLVVCFSFAVPVYGATDCWGQPDVVTPEGIVTLKAFECIFARVLNIATRLAGLAVFVMLILGGWQYITSGGEKQATQKARNTLTYAVLGLVLIIGSWFVLRFITFFTKVDVTKFVISP